MHDTDIRLKCLRLANGDVAHAERLYAFVRGTANIKPPVSTATEVGRHAAEADAIVEEMKA